MLKAIIADDEKWICQMISKLIDWGELGIELVGQAEDGLEAFNLIQTQHPDIVITDIRMPGIDGIDLVKKTREMNLQTHFIIISGFKHFEYAKNAIKYGVDDYLLKPIKKDELTHILEKICQEYDEIRSRKIKETEIKKKFDENTNKLKEQYLGKILQDQGEVEINLAQINSEYRFSFCEGIFQVFSVKLDRKKSGIQEREDEYRKRCYREYFEILDNRLDTHCCDIQRLDENTFLLNYLSPNTDLVKKGIKETFTDFQNYLNGLNYFDVTIGLGNNVNALDKISESSEIAKRGIMCRIKYGVNKIINYSEFEFARYDIKDILSKKEERTLINIVETLDVDGFQKFVDQKFNVKELKEEVNPCVYFKIADRITRLYVDTISRSIAGRHVDPEITIDVDNLLDCKDVGEIADKLRKDLIGNMQKCAQEIDEYDWAPIRMAKQYVCENYQKSITLDQVAQIVNMNPVYFSSFFKKKTGLNFREFIIDYRIDIAKELLLDIQYNIAQISQMVGYSDAKYFSKLFKKKIGVNPKDYRKIHL